jgi:S-adenosylmethionine:diacylglycerol 3-amino-3-carboxypropyl transferase
VRLRVFLASSGFGLLGVWRVSWAGRRVIRVLGRAFFGGPLINRFASLGNENLGL